MQASSRYLGNSSMITDLRWTAETTRGNSADLPPQSQSVFPYSYLKRKRQEKFKSFDSLAGRSVLFSRMNVFLSISLSTSSPPAHLATRPPLSRLGSSMGRKANSNLCMAASASSQHQGNAASRLPASRLPASQPAPAEQSEGGAAHQESGSGAGLAEWEGLIPEAKTQGHTRPAFDPRDSVTSRLCGPQLPLL